MPIKYETLAQAKTMFKPYSGDMMHRVIDIVLREAKQREDDAAYGGSMTDGGAEQLRAEADCFLAGIRGTIPERWRKYIDMAEHESDPEYAEYQRLRKKFESDQ